MSHPHHRAAIALASLALVLLAAPVAAQGIKSTKGSVASDPLTTHATARATAKEANILAELLDGIPAFGMELNVNTFQQQYMTFDLTSPDTSTHLAPMPIAQLATGTFINYDFQHHYILSKLNKMLVMDTSDGSIVQTLDTAPELEYEFWTGLRWDPETLNTYATACTSNGSGCFLYTIDMSTGDATRIAEVGNPGEGWFPMEIAIDSKGRLYMINIGTNSSYNWLTLIDKHTGAVTPIGATGISPMYIQGLDFDRRDDTLYWAAMGNLSPTGGPQGHLYTIDTDTGVPTFLGILPNGGSEVWALSIATAPETALNDAIFADGFESP